MNETSTAVFPDAPIDVIVSSSPSPRAERNVSSGNTELYGFYMHPHWQKYIETITATPDVLRFAVGVFIMIICMVGVAGNLTAMVVFLRAPNLRKPSSMLVFNLAVSDLTFSLILGLPLISIASPEKKWIWGDTACSMYGFTGGLSGLNSINSLVMISIDRYLAISCPLKYKNRVTRIRALQMMGFSWIWALIWALPPMLGWSQYVTEGLQISCTFDYLTRTTANICYIYCLFGFGFALPLTIIVTCYAGIVRAVKRNSMEMTNIDDLLEGRDRLNRVYHQHELQSVQNEMNLAKVAALMITLFVASWLPYAVVAQLGITGHQEYITPYVAQFPVILAKSSAIWNPIVYSLGHHKYKVALAALLPGTLRRLFCPQMAA